jgi:hypothetical protein
MIGALQLNGKGERTQQAYTRSVRMLCQFYDKTPDLISEPELQEYFLCRKNVDHWSLKTMRICYCGIRFFYVNVQNRTVLFRYRNPHSERSRVLALDVIEFIRRFLQHVLPTGFMKIRYYGFMNPNCRIPLERIRGLIELSYGFAVDLPVPEIEPRRLNTCPSCGGLLKLRSVLPILPSLKILRRSG